MANRIFYAVHSINFGGVTSGFQSVSVNSSVDFEQVFELGRLDVYENLEGVPSVEITAERAFPRTGSTMWGSAAGGTTTAAAIARPTIGMSVADDSQASYSAQSWIQATGTYISSWSCNFPVEGFATESCTVVGNHVGWSSGTGGPIQATATGNPAGTNLVVRRQDVGAAYPRLQNVSFSADIGREDLFQLGQKSPYFRAATFPIETTSDWEYLDTSSRSGPPSGSRLTFTADQNSDATSDVTASFFGVSIGAGARLNATNYSGGDAGGGNATVTYSYIAYNYLTAP